MSDCDALNRLVSVVSSSSFARVIACHTVISTGLLDRCSASSGHAGSADPVVEPVGPAAFEAPPHAESSTARIRTTAETKRERVTA